MTYFHSLKKKPSVPSLQELCVQVLIDNKQSLGDVGDIPSHVLRPVLSHCTPEELRRIEDLTMEASGKDIRWDTWQIWKRIYVSKYGKTNPDDVPALKVLSHEVDLDHLPEGLGDYRSLYETKTRRMDAQRAKLIEKLRQMKKKEQISKERTKAKRVDLVSIKKQRGRERGSKTIVNCRKNRSGVSAAEFYQKIGVSRKSGFILKRR